MTQSTWFPFLRSFPRLSLPGRAWLAWPQRPGLPAAIAAIALATLLMHSLDNAMVWLYGGGEYVWTRSVVALTYYTLAGVLVWSVAQHIAPRLERMGASLGLGFTARLACGMVLLLAGLAAVTALCYGVLFPLMMGRPVRPFGLYAIAFKVGAVALIVYGWLLFARSAHGARTDSLTLQAQADRLAASLDQAELAVLQAQIEPHFLFNTLALVKRQYRVQPDEAVRLLDALIVYLDSAAPALRQGRWTLGDELALLRQYCDILARRFGQRFSYQIPDVAPPLADVRLPALVLATLAENAVRHGLAPKAGAGAVAVLVTRTETELVLEVCDDGVGLRGHGGSGQGLSTVRARLRGAYGAGARLLVQPNQPSGVRAVLRLPYPLADPGAANLCGLRGLDHQREAAHAD